MKRREILGQNFYSSLGVLMLGGLAIYISWPQSKDFSVFLGDNNGLLFSQRQVLANEVSFYKVSKPTPNLHLNSSVAETSIDLADSDIQPTFLQFSSPMPNSLGFVAYQDGPGGPGTGTATISVVVQAGQPAQCSAHEASPVPPSPRAPVCSTAGSDQGSRGNETVDCSILAGTACSVQNDAEPDQNRWRQCSVVIDDVVNVAFTFCSTVPLAGTNSGYCSTFVQKNEPGGNRTCSILTNGNVGGQVVTSCSVLQGLTNIACSTTGGNSGGTAPDGTPIPGDGNAACSVGNAFPLPIPTAPNGSQCSVVNVQRLSTCSTSSGEHQNCSVGWLRENQAMSCSVTGMPSSELQFCSVKDGVGPAALQNKCSALNGDGFSETPSTYTCSVVNVDVNNNNQFCSIVSTATNSQCSVVEGIGGTPKCSAFDSTGADVNQAPNVRCSTIVWGPPTVVTGPALVTPPGELRCVIGTPKKHLPPPPPPGGPGN